MTLPASKWRLVWSLFMIAVYVGMAVLLICFSIFDIKQTYRILIGAIFALYGLFRGYRVWKQGY